MWNPMASSIVASVAVDFGLLVRFDMASLYLAMVITLASRASLYFFDWVFKSILKKIIAYSSIGHMNLVTIGIFSNTLAAVLRVVYTSWYLTD
jgi:NADH:ubiquinone oxidoreductase subunit 4 (subunit M)